MHASINGYLLQSVVCKGLEYFLLKEGVVGVLLFLKCGMDAFLALYSGEGTVLLLAFVKHCSNNDLSNNIMKLV